VPDNSSTHKTPSIQSWLVRHPRFTLHFATYSSWRGSAEVLLCRADHEVDQAWPAARFATLVASICTCAPG
jgi:hypothetical protein